ncbi:MAG: tetratricopeptide repeat protein, partial [bacterium]
TTPAPGSQRPLAVLGGIMAAVVVIGALLVGLNIGNLREKLQGKESLSPIRSLAVLPLDNMMGDAGQDFFVEGMHEALITELSKIGTLRVISRTSAMHYAGTDKSIPEIARELEDILNLFSEVAQAIAGEIDIVLTPQQQERLATDRTIDPDVYELLLRGQHHLNKFTYQDALEARRFFEQAVAADPNSAMAHAFLAGSYIVFGIVGDVPPREVFPPARDSAIRALELDPDHGGAYAVLGFVELYFNWDWAAAERELRRALELDPSNGYTLHGLADVLTIYGRFDEAVALVKRGRQFDPFSYLRNLVVWIHLLFAGRYEEAITEIEQWRAFSGDPQAGWHILYSSYYQQGQFEKAMVELRHSVICCDPESEPFLEEAYAAAGIRGASLVRAERLTTLSQSEYTDPLTVARYFALAGNADQTFAWLERAYEEHVPTIHMIAQPALDPYRSDPRYVDLMQRMGIPESGWRIPGREED